MFDIQIDDVYDLTLLFYKYYNIYHLIFQYN